MRNTRQPRRRTKIVIVVGQAAAYEYAYEQQCSAQARLARSHRGSPGLDTLHRQERDFIEGSGNSNASRARGWMRSGGMRVAALPRPSAAVSVGAPGRRASLAASPAGAAWECCSTYQQTNQLQETAACPLGSA